MDEYDIVFLGFPIWWYVAPTIINTFLESYDMSGKVLNGNIDEDEIGSWLPEI